MTARRDAMLVLLALGAGAMDAISFLGLDQVFTANMSGNTVLLGLALVQGEGLGALRAGISLGGFVLGVAIATVVMQRASGRGDWPPSVSLAIGLECVPLAAFAVAWSIAGSAPSAGATYALIVLAACAMGIQGAAVRRLHVADVATIVVTSTFASIAAGLAARLSGDRLGVPQAPEPAQPLAFRATIVGALFAGAVAGGALELHWHGGVAFVPLIAIAAVAGVAAGRSPRPA